MQPFLLPLLPLMLLPLWVFVNAICRILLRLKLLLLHQLLLLLQLAFAFAFEKPQPFHGHIICIFTGVYEYFLKFSCCLNLNTKSRQNFCLVCMQWSQAYIILVICSFIRSFICSFLGSFCSLWGVCLLIFKTVLQIFIHLLLHFICQVQAQKSYNFIILRRYWKLLVNASSKRRRKKEKHNEIKEQNLFKKI